MKQWVLIGSLVLALIGSVFYNLKIKSDLSSRNNKLNEQLMQAQLEIGKAHTQFGDAEDYADELSKALQEQLDKNKELIVAYGKLKAKLNVQGGGTTIIETTPGPSIPTDLHLVPKAIYLSLDESNLTLLGKKLGLKWSDNRINLLGILSSDPELSFGVNYELNLRIGGQLVQTITESGAINHYVNLYEIDKDGKKLNDFQLTEFEVIVKDQRTDHFFWWAPHLDLGVIGGYNQGLQLGATLGFSFMGYGKTENDLTWRFIRPGLTLSDRPGIDLGIASYNLGEPLPLISNLWITPYIGWSFMNSFGGGLILSLVL